MTIELFVYLLDLAGVAVFAITGTLAAQRKQMDLFGVIVLATLTAIGGGTMRDVILGSFPVFWIADSIYPIVSSVTAIAGFFFIRNIKPTSTIILFADAVGLATFTIIGTEKALSVGTSVEIAIIMGMITGVFGGVIRDLLSGDVPVILRREIYATASLSGGIIYIVLTVYAEQRVAGILLGFLTVLILRLVAIRWNLRLPTIIPPSD